MLKTYLWIIPALLTLIAAVWFMLCWAGSRRGSLRPADGSAAAFSCRLHPMQRQDIIPLIAVTVIYAVTAFTGLGSGKAPESLLLLSDTEQEAVVEFSDTEILGEIWFYTGIKTGKYSVETSLDGERWGEPMEFEQKNAELLRWVKLELNPRSARWVRIRAADPPLYLGELAFFDVNGVRIDAKGQADGALLTDDTDTVPDSPTYLNGSYFDEIYHVRTAYEHIINIKPYEVSHPPLGKLIISLGIRIFGLNPFGWRFMGTLFGVLMLPALYILLKNMFGKTVVSVCGTLVFAFDFMHFVQTRIATIDTYGVFFILLMYLFMYRYFARPADAPLRKTVLPLFLSGLCFGLGAASKWIVLYGGAGLAILWLIRQIAVGREYKNNGKSGFVKYITATVMLSAAFFVVIPCVIYLLAYLPYGSAEGVKPFSAEYLKIVLDNQRFMFSYHSGLVATHPYSSPWWIWVLDGRPILYYLEYLDGGMRSAFAAFGNPLVWWTGLLALAACTVNLIRHRNGNAMFILIAYLSQLVPWIFVSRICFIYHYFPSAMFLAVAIALMMNDIVDERHIRGKWSCLLFTAFCLILFVMFYPALTGVPVSGDYAGTWLHWFMGAYPF